jgi:polyisoprenoid-binding protein YceI
MKKTLAALCGLTLTLATPALANGWSLSPDESKIAFGSVKKDTVGEVHHFGDLSGSVDDDGKVAVEIDVASVETWIDIRNERIRKMVLNAAPKVMLTAEVDMAELEAMKPGDTDVIDVDGTLSLNGAEMDIETSLFIARLTDDKMMAVTDEMIMLSTEDAGIDEGVSTLMKLADLPGITRVSPVTLRLVFTR